MSVPIRLSELAPEHIPNIVHLLSTNASLAVISAAPAGLVLQLPLALERQARVVVAVSSVARAEDLARIARNMLSEQAKRVVTIEAAEKEEAKKEEAVAAPGVERSGQGFRALREKGLVTPHLRYTSVKRLYQDILDEKMMRAWDVLVFDEVHDPLLYRDLAFSVWASRTGKGPRLLLLGTKVTPPLVAATRYEIKLSRYPTAATFAEAAVRDRFAAITRATVEYLKKTKDFAQGNVIVFMESERAMSEIAPQLRDAVVGLDKRPEIILFRLLDAVRVLERLRTSRDRLVILVSDRVEPFLPLSGIAALIDGAHGRRRTYTDWGAVVYRSGPISLEDSLARRGILGIDQYALFYSVLPRSGPASRRPAEELHHTKYPQSLLLEPIMRAVRRGLDPVARLRRALSEQLYRALDMLVALGYVAEERKSTGALQQRTVYTVLRKPQYKSVAPDLSEVILRAEQRLTTFRRLEKRSLLYLIAGLIENYQAGVLRYPEQVLHPESGRPDEAMMAYFSRHFSAFAGAQPLETSIRALLSLRLNEIFVTDDRDETKDVEAVIGRDARRLGLRLFEVARVLETTRDLMREQGFTVLGIEREGDVDEALYVFAEAYRELFPEREYKLREPEGSSHAPENPLQTDYVRLHAEQIEMRYQLSRQLAYPIASARTRVPEYPRVLALSRLARPSGARLGIMTLWLAAPSPHEVFFEPTMRRTEITLVPVGRAPTVIPAPRSRSGFDWVTMRFGTPVETPASPLRNTEYKLSTLQRYAVLRRPMRARPATRAEAIARYEAEGYPLFERVPRETAYLGYEPQFETAAYTHDEETDLHSQPLTYSVYDVGYKSLIMTEEATEADALLLRLIDPLIARYRRGDREAAVEVWRNVEKRRAAIDAALLPTLVLDTEKLREELGHGMSGLQLSWVKAAFMFIGAQEGLWRVLDMFVGWGAVALACAEEGYEYQGFYSLAADDTEARTVLARIVSGEASLARKSAVGEGETQEEEPYREIIYPEDSEVEIYEKDFVVFDAPPGNLGVHRGALDAAIVSLVPGGWLMLRAGAEFVKELGMHVDAHPDMVYRGPIRLKRGDAMFFWRKGGYGKAVARFF